MEEKPPQRLPAKATTVFTSEPGAPVVILVNPQLAENIGSCARAMLNCGLTEMRLVKPRTRWPHPNASASASGADQVLDNAKLYDTTAEAVADLQQVFATTARQRGMAKPLMTAREAATKVRAFAAGGERCGILFGPERTGLENDDVAAADFAVTVPLNPGFTSLNLGQAVLILAYEWYQAGGPTNEAPMMGTKRRRSPGAGKQEMQSLFDHLEDELGRAGFLFPVDKRPRMIRNIRTMLLRAAFTEQEVRTFRGMIKALANPRPNRGNDE
ncbi:MAG TPA: RNA methyltransferase [Alphaproteobacteria bacterium]|jgi:tRNA/rRNA methyltransferase